MPSENAVVAWVVFLLMNLAFIANYFMNLVNFGSTGNMLLAALGVIGLIVNAALFRRVF